MDIIRYLIKITEKTVINIIDDISNIFDGADVKEDVMKFLGVVYGNGWIRTK